MKKFISRYGKMTLVALFGLCIFLFWYCGYPQALCYQEQNQLFLWSADYFWHDLSVAGGLADYIFYLCTRNHESQSWLMGVKVY